MCYLFASLVEFGVLRVNKRVALGSRSGLCSSSLAQATVHCDGNWGREEGIVGSYAKIVSFLRSSLPLLMIRFSSLVSLVSSPSPPPNNNPYLFDPCSSVLDPKNLLLQQSFTSSSILSPQSSERVGLREAHMLMFFFWRHLVLSLMMFFPSFLMHQMQTCSIQSSC